jgi:uncharacterized protein YutE (UPF0331/DUF86 family)
MVDKTVLSTRVSAVRDAVARIRAVLPADVEAFLADRTTREVVILNLFVALQDSLAMATHWLADAGWEVPTRYGDVFKALGKRDVVTRDLAERLAAASGLRNLIAHQYAVLDWRRIHEIAARHLDDLLAFCEELARRAEASAS